MRSWPWHLLSLFVWVIVVMYLGFTTFLQGMNSDPDWAMTRHESLTDQDVWLTFVGVFGVLVWSAFVASWRRIREVEKRLQELERRQGVPIDAAGATQR